MLEILYVATMIIAFTSNFMGATTNYYVRLSMGLFWIIIWVLRSRFILHANKILKYLIFPWFCIFLLSILLWIINRPSYLDVSYVTRMCSNIIYCVIAVLNAYIGFVLFGSGVIKLSFVSLISSIGLNAVNVWLTYGSSNMINYLSSVLIGDYEYGSVMHQISTNMEVQGSTMALGAYFLFYLFFDKDANERKKILYIILSVIGLYLGFKRVVLLGVIVVICILWVLKRERINSRSAILYASICFSILAFGYIVSVKNGLISLIAAYFNINMMGRDSIYRAAANLYSISPFYLGTGFTVASRYMYDTTGFAIHSDIVRMYIELGFIPFVGWLWYYLYYIPQKIVLNYGKEAGKICLTITVFVFSTFLVENTITLYPLQYALTTFTIFMINDEISHKMSNIGIR